MSLKLFENKKQPCSIIEKGMIATTVHGEKNTVTFPRHI